MLDTDTDGLLKSAPTVTYSKKIITDKVKVDMYYLEPNDEIVGYEEDGTTPIYNTDYRLKYVFNGQNVIDQAAADAAAAVNNAAVYTNYQQYLDYLQGKTTYVPTDSWTQGDDAVAGTDDLRALDADNKTGLNDYDIYDQDAPNSSNDKVRNTNLSDFSYNRLEDLKYGTNYDVADYGNAATDGNASANKKAAAQYGLQGLYNFASPKMSDYEGVTTVDGAWAAAEKAAEGSRQKVNTGVQAAADLASIKSTVEAAIGRSDDDADDPKTGLKLTRSGVSATDPVGTNTWSADLTSGETVKDPVAFGLAFDTGAIVTGTETFAADKIYFKNTSEGLANTANAVNSTMTADNVLESRFKDVGKIGTFGGSGEGSQVHFTTPTSPTQAASGDFKDAWDAYVQQTKRKLLIEKKIELVEACKNEGGVAVLTETNVVRSVEEANRILAVLNDEKAGIMVDYKEAKDTYEAAVKAVVSDIATMNTLQEKVDTANKEYNTYILDSAKTEFTYAADDATVADTIAKKDAIVINVLQGDGATTTHGQADTPVEDTFEAYLTAAYGTAHKDADTAGYESTYTATKVNPAPTDRTTYSKSVTETDIKGATTYKNDGDDANGTATLTANAALSAGEINNVKAAPYWRLLQVDNMRTFINGKSTGYYNDYKTAADKLALNKTESEQSTEPVVVYIGLGDIGNDLKADGTGKWQYVGNATEAKTANQFDFGYTEVLGAGKTSNKLIEYVKFADSVNQDSFLDMVFDINVGVESAQVVYNGDRVGAQAAQASLSPIIPTQAEYDDSDALVNWAKRTDEVSDANKIDDKDPNPKAEASVAAETPAGGTGTGGEGGTGTGGETPATENVDVVVDGADAEHNLIKMVKTGTGDSATWAVADSGSTITDADSEHHYTINGSGEYRTVNGLTYALSTVTGDTTPAVAYVADNPNP